MQPYSPQNDVERRFLDFAERHPECSRRASFDLLLRHNYMELNELQPWPVLVTPDEAAHYAELSLGLTRLIQAIPSRFFDDRPARVAEFYGLSSELMAALILSRPNGIDEALYRGDFIDSGDGMKCIEMNGGTGVSGWDLAALAGLYAKVPILERFFRENRLELAWDNSVRLMFRYFLDRMRSDPAFRDEGELNVGITVSADDHDLYNLTSQEMCRQEYAAALAAVDPGLRGTVSFCDYAEVSFEDGAPHHRGMRLHTLFEQAVDEAAGSQAFRSFKAGQVHLYTGPATRVILDKRNLALLSEFQETGRFDERERRVIREAIPWTRRLAAVETEYRGQRVALPDVLAGERERLVLKRGYSYGGKDVFLGHATPRPEWDEAVRKALEDGDWIVQEFLEPRPHLLLSRDDEPVPHDVVWGFFVFGDRFGGGFLRLQPKDRRAVVNVTLGGAESLPYLIARPVDS